MDNEKAIGELLHYHGLKKTPIRTEMLSLFMSHDVALSASDIVSLIKANHDKVTIYRALYSFEEHGILHKASEDVQGIKYALCSRECPDTAHTEQHAHFNCEECNHTYCLEDVFVPKIQLSNEFSVNSAHYVFNGICKSCRAAG